MSSFLLHFAQNASQTTTAVFLPTRCTSWPRSTKPSAASRSTNRSVLIDDSPFCQLALWHQPWHLLISRLLLGEPHRVVQELQGHVQKAERDLEPKGEEPDNVHWHWGFGELNLRTEEDARRAKNEKRRFRTPFCFFGLFLSKQMKSENKLMWVKTRKWDILKTTAS